MNRIAVPAVAVIGTGQLGSRHLQSLARLANPPRALAVEPVEARAAAARARLAEAGGLKAEFFASVAALPPGLDVAIVATASDAREKVVAELLETKRPRFLILEKFLFQRPAAYGRIGALLRETGARAWVNCPRRLWPFYRALKPRFKAGEPLDYHVSGSQLGIGSNAIHPLDHLAFLSGDEDFSVATQGLDPGTRASKRPGFVEFTGTLAARGRRGSSLTMRSFDEAGVPPLITLASPSLRAVIREAEGRAWIAEASSGWKWNEESFAVPLQSELTASVVADLLERGDCGLTPYEESSRLHLPLLAALMGHIGGEKGRPPEACPIT